MTNSLSQKISFGLLGVTALLLSLAFVVGNRPLGVVAVLLIAAVWGVLIWRNGRAASWPALLLVLAAALADLPVGSPGASSTLVWRYLGVVGVLLLWDLSRFDRRLQSAADAAAAQPLIMAHLRRLGLLVALALAALAVQQLLPLSFNFDLALLSGLALALGLNALLRRLQA